MNIRVSSITLALLLVINSVVIAETTTMFVREDNESSEITLYLEEGVVDEMAMTNEDRGDEIGDEETEISDEDREKIKIRLRRVHSSSGHTPLSDLSKGTQETRSEGHSHQDL